METFAVWSGSTSGRAAVAFLAAFACSLLLTAVTIQVASKFGLVAKPSKERWHRKPTALFGGVAIFLASLIVSLFLLRTNPDFLALALSSLFIFAIGLYDDCRPLRPAHKFIAQLVAACLFVGIFYARYEPPQLTWLIPVMIIWIVGITNAFNLLDNMDGLSAGVAAIVAVLMAVHSGLMGHTGIMIASIILGGAACGFLVFNFNPARIFMGDSGSLFLGFSLACLSIMSHSRVMAGNLFTALLLPTVVLATPVFDTMFVSVVRSLNGRKISQGGRDHTSHRLVMLGLSERRAVTWLYFITLWFGGLGLWGSSSDNSPLIFAVTVLSAIALLVLGIFLAEVQTYSEEEYEQARARQRESKTVLSRLILHKRHFVEALLDFCLLCACWILAFLLRFDGELRGYERVMSLALPCVAACQMIAFYACGFYQGLWRYITLSDARNAVISIVMGTAVASGLIRLFAPFNFPWSVMVIYAMLLLIAVIAMRAGLRALRFHFAAKWREGVRLALVIGAGDAGELAVREMFHNKSLRLQPVGFLDDDPAKHRARIHGVRVLGPRSQLLDVVERFGVDEVIIAMPSVGGTVDEMIGLCKQNGIAYRQVRGIIL